MFQTENFLNLKKYKNHINLKQVLVFSLIFNFLETDITAKNVRYKYNQPHKIIVKIKGNSTIELYISAVVVRKTYCVFEVDI